MRPATISTLSVGSHAIVASYGGDAGNAGSTSNTLLQVINTASGGTNVAAATAGGSGLGLERVQRQSPVAAINNNERAGADWGSGGGWNDATADAFPDWVQIDFNGSKTIDRVVVYTLQDNYPNPVEPTDTLTFSHYGVTDFTVAGLEWHRLGDAWHGQRQQPGQAHRHLRRLHHHRIRVNVTNALACYSRLTEIEAWGAAAAGPPPSTTHAGELGAIRRRSGTQVTFTATVTGTQSDRQRRLHRGTAMRIGGCSAVALTGSGNARTATCSTSALSQGTHSIVASLWRGRRQRRLEQQSV